MTDSPNQKNRSRRATVYAILNGDLNSNDKKRSINRHFDIFLIVLISANVLAVILESVEEYQLIYARTFFVFEFFSVIVFTIEYLARIWASVEDRKYTYTSSFVARLRYSITPLAIIDFLAVLPFYLSFLVGIDLRFMRVLRLARIFKLTRYSSAMTMLLKVFRQEAQSFGAALFVMFILMIFSASMIYLFEHKAQPEAFSDIPKAMWWAVVTLTTVGYGDVYPITGMGKFFGAAISVIGVGMVALPAGILASGFSDQLHQSRSAYQHKVLDILEDGVVTDLEAVQLRDLQETLGLSSSDAMTILRITTRGNFANEIICPNCGEAISAKTSHKHI